MLLALLAVVLVAGSALWWSAGHGSGPDSDGAGGRSAEAPDDVAAAPVSSAGPRIAAHSAAPDESGVDDRAARASSNAAVSQGTGLLLGRVVAAAGATLPREGRVVLEPIPWPDLPMRGGSEARRERSFTSDQPDFTFEDLPYGAYRVHAVAAGMDSRFSDLVLRPGSDRMHKTVELRRAGFVDGVVLDEQGEPLEGLRVRLEAQYREEVLETVTNAAGEWLLSGVPIGEYLVSLGDARRPLAPPRGFQFHGGSARFPEQRVAPGSSIFVRAIDMRGDPVVAARVQGFERAGGPWDEITDAHGMVQVRYLTPGRYTAEVSHASGLSGRTNIDVTGTERGMAFQVVCRAGNGREWR